MRTNQSQDLRKTAEHFCSLAVREQDLGRAQLYWKIATTWVRMAQEAEEEVEELTSAKAPAPSPHPGLTAPG